MILDFILSRRSIRKYTSEPVPDEIIENLLKAAMSAPTAAGEIWHFIVVRKRELFEPLRQIHPHSHMLETASAVIIICGDPTLERLQGRWLLDCAAATENILIAANVYGLGACWIGIYPVQERIDCLKSSFNIPENIIPLSMVSIGYPDESKQPSNRFRSDKIHREKW
jgi:nitroreductase